MEMEQATVATTEPTAEQASTESAIGQENNSKTETTDETLTLTQSEIDRRITGAVYKALEKEREKHEQQIKLAEQKRLEEAGNYKAAYERMKAELEQKEFHAQVLNTATEKNLTQYIDVLSMLPNIESVNKAVELLDAQFKAAVEQEVNKRLNSTAPISGKAPIHKSVEHMDDEEYKKYRKQQFPKSL